MKRYFAWLMVGGLLLTSACSSTTEEDVSVEVVPTAETTETEAPIENLLETPKGKVQLLTHQYTVINDKTAYDWTYQYDKSGNMILCTTTMPDGSKNSVENTAVYDDKGVVLVQDSPLKYVMELNNDGYLISIMTENNDIRSEKTTISYDDTGKIEQCKTYINGTPGYINYVYDEFGSLVAMESYLSLPEPEFYCGEYYHYTRDADNNIISYEHTQSFTNKDEETLLDTADVLYDNGNIKAIHVHSIYDGQPLSQHNLYDENGFLVQREDYSDNELVSTTHWEYETKEVDNFMLYRSYNHGPTYNYFLKPSANTYSVEYLKNLVN